SARLPGDGSRRRLEEQAVGFSFLQRIAPRLVQGRCETDEIHHGRDPAAMSVHRFEMEAAVGPGYRVLGTREHAAGFRIARRVVAHFAVGAASLERRSQSHAPNASGGEHALLDELFISLARDLLNHTPKEAIAEIRVGVTSARIKVERLAEHPS